MCVHICVSLCVCAYMYTCVCVESHFVWTSSLSLVRKASFSGCPFQVQVQVCVYTQAIIIHMMYMFCDL